MAVPIIFRLITSWYNNFKDIDTLLFIYQSKNIQIQ
jgi:HKD family nuclease